MNTVDARVSFLRWLKNENPGVYNRVIDAAREEGVSGLAGSDGFWDKIVGAVQTIVPTVVQAKAQRDLYKMQLTRANRGLPPIDAASIAPVIRTQVDIAPETRAALAREAGAGMKKLAIPAAIGLGLLLFVFVTRKK